MKRFVKYICLFFLVIFSFFYTKKISDIIINHTSLMKQIKSSAYLYETKSVDAIVIDDKVIPGMYGIKIDYQKSYYKMRDQNTFSSSKLVYKEIKPNISIENNKDLIITKGRSDKKKVAIIFSNNKNLLSKTNLKLTRVINKNIKPSSFEYITNNSDIKVSSHICYKTKIVKCPNNYYQVTPTYIIKKYLDIKGKTSSGDLIFVSDEMSNSDFKMLLKEISYRDLQVDYLSNVLSEKR